MTSLHGPILIYGLGKSGRAALRLIRLLGIADNDICLVDERELADTAEGLRVYKAPPISKHFSTWIVSPGVALSKAVIVDAKKSGSRIESELSISVEHLQDEKIVGITGSMGKSTTSALLHFALESAGCTSFLGGNFGTPLADYICDCLQERRPRAQFLVLELSSYQLENAGSLQVDVAAIVSLAPNHLERYESLDAYYQTKLAIVQRSKTSVVLGAQSPDLRRESVNLLAGARTGLKVQFSDNSENVARVASLSGQPKLAGQHNLDNIRIAAQMLEDLGVGAGLMGLYSFSGLSHRLENLGIVRGVEVFNDSKATSISSVHRAIETLVESRPNKRIHCLVGGRDKKLPWETLLSFPNRERVLFYCFGECADLASRAAGIAGPTFVSLSAAVSYVAQLAQSNEIILLSPGGTSLDEFSNFEQRGDWFKARILELLRSKA